MWTKSPHLPLTQYSPTIANIACHTDRLLQKHYKFINLNPFEVLQLPLDASADEIKMRYRKLSALVHPDKCDDPRAQDAFQEVKRAYEQMQNSERKELCITLIEQATENVKKERKKLVRAVAARVRGQHKL